MQNVPEMSMDRLFRAIASLQTKEEAAAFFEDVCTITELIDMSQRLETAMMLDKGDNYQTISREIGISTATISRVSKCINYGSGGYKIVIDRLKEEENREKEEKE